MVLLSYCAVTVEVGTSLYMGRTGTCRVGSKIVIFCVVYCRSESGWSFGRKSSSQILIYGYYLHRYRDISYNVSLLRLFGLHLRNLKGMAGGCFFSWTTQAEKAQLAPAGRTAFLGVGDGDWNKIKCRAGAPLRFCLGALRCRRLQLSWIFLGIVNFV